MATHQFFGLRFSVCDGQSLETVRWLDDEIEKEEQIARKSSNAGWTVICNDRIVLPRDKTAITGWGVGDVPQYHPQFISIAGVVRFSSNKSFNLPLNTTKRGLDTSSIVYWHAINFMMEGVKKFTDFTNHWKGRQAEASAKFEGLTPKDATEVSDEIADSDWRPVRGSDGKAKRFTPDLPRPTTDETKRRVSFVRLKEDIQILGGYFYDNPVANPNEVGGRCFDEALKQAKEKK